MLSTSLIICVALLYGSSYSSNNNGILIKTTEGYVEGIDRDGILQFIGIPYAKPPINELRFEPPQSLEQRPEKDVLDATQTLDSVPSCPQIAQVLQNEDCLYLNIFAPPNNYKRKNKKLPVMLWVHGGNFQYGGTSYKSLYDPTNWVNNPNVNDVIIVTINYRIGALGWLYDNTELGTGINGNFGYLDVLQAKKWVYRNIKSFGGDPENIIVFGHSAGAYLVLLQLLYNPEYIHGAILQSPSILIPLRDPVTWYNTFETFAGFVNCTNPLTITECLKNVPVEVILTAQNATFQGYSIYGMPYPGNEWTWSPNDWFPTAFTDIIPNQALFEFQDNDVETPPFIIGTVRDEQYFDFSQDLIGIDYETFVGLLAYRADGVNIFYGESVTYESAPITFSVLAEYGLFPQNSQQNISLTGDFQDDLLEIFTDYWYCSIRNVLKNINDTNGIYYYNFHYLNRQTNAIGVLYDEEGCVDKVCHGADLFYEFQQPAFQSQFDNDTNKMGDVIQQLFTDFAEDLKISYNKWPQYTNNENKAYNFLRILGPADLIKESTFSSESRLGTNLISEANDLCEFWDEIGYLYGSERSLDDYDDDNNSISPAFNNDENGDVKGYQHEESITGNDNDLYYILFGSIGAAICGLIIIIFSIICCYKKRMRVSHKELSQMENDVDNVGGMDSSAL